MTQEFLQDTMVADLKELFSHERLKNSLGVEREIQIYPQDVPIRRGDDEAIDKEAPPEPYVVVRLRGGKTESDDDPQIMTRFWWPVSMTGSGAPRLPGRLAHHQQNLPSLFRLRRDRKSLGDPLPHGVGHPRGGHPPALSHGNVPADPGAGGPQGGARGMTTKKQAKAAEEAGTLVYCGPTIPGVAKQFTFYRGGVTAGLKAAQERRPVLRALTIPLDQLPEAMKQLEMKHGRIYALYREAQRQK